MRSALLILFATGCGLFGSGGTTSGGTTGGGTTSGNGGFGMPTLEVTVNGAHAGPATPDGNSYASLINEYDANGELTRSSLQLVASSTVADASCSLFADRYGDFTTSFGVGQWLLTDTAGTNGVGDGQAIPEGSPAASTTQGIFSCSGSDCDGVGISISAMDSAHAEGYFSGTLGGADIICAFYLPMRTFSP